MIVSLFQKPRLALVIGKMVSVVVIDKEVAVVISGSDTRSERLTI